MFFLAMALIVYMPLHVFIAQSASLVTGGLEVWKAAKDVILFALAPFLLLVAYHRKLFSDKTFRVLAATITMYVLIYGAFLFFDFDDDNYSAIVGTVYNTRLMLYLLLGYVVGSATIGKKYVQYALTAVVLIAAVVALFGVAQYFLPHDILTHVGYTLDRGVKPLFFIDDKPDLPRVMSTLKDPNSLGAYLIVPILLTGYALVNRKANVDFFVREFKRSTLVIILVLLLSALFLTFSRGALLSLLLSIVVAVSLSVRDHAVRFARKYALSGLVIVAAVSGLVFLSWDSYLVQNYVFHADESTVLEDPNELRVSLGREAVERIGDQPIGYGPGSAGLVSINNPNGSFLTENYYLQLAYEVGWLGAILFVVVLLILALKLFSLAENSQLSSVLLASLTGYMFYSLLIHLWSNEAVALQWWSLCGVFIGVETRKSQVSCYNEIRN